jgi:hypothetical protein
MAFNNITPLQLGQAAITTAYTTLYTVPISPATRTFIKNIDIINTTAASIDIYVSLVPSGGTAGTSNALFYESPLPPFTIVQWAGSQIINSGATIQIKASATGCTITASGGEAI